MENNQVRKNAILKSITKMVADKESVRSYLKGEISNETLTKRGIKLAQPL